LTAGGMILLMSTIPPDELQQYVKNADALIFARTQQLRTAITLMENLTAALKAVSQAKTLETAKGIAEEALRNHKRSLDQSRGQS
jgi:hypothetical protein